MNEKILELIRNGYSIKFSPVFISPGLLDVTVYHESWDVGVTVKMSLSMLEHSKGDLISPTLERCEKEILIKMK